MCAPAAAGTRGRSKGEVWLKKGGQGQNGVQGHAKGVEIQMKNVPERERGAADLPARCRHVRVRAGQLIAYIVGPDVRARVGIVAVT